MRFAGTRVATLAALILCAVPASASAATQFEIGAAKVDTTPPDFNPTQDLIDFPEADLLRATVCPRATFGGDRDWRFEEPYADTDSSGDFNYPLSMDPIPVPAPEPYCDYNHNGRWDGIYSSGGIDVHLDTVHDPIDARAIAVSDGEHTVVIVSVVAQGLHENYLDTARTLAKAAPSPGNPDGRPGIDDVVISANHNESSPDTVGIYGGPDLGGVAGANSGIDDYYYEFLQHQIAHASAQAFDSMQPATLRETEFNVPSNLEQELSHNFPTTNDDGSPAAIDPKVRVLQARGIGGTPIFTMANVAAHNQEIGHGDHTNQISSDWPGYFHSKLEADGEGMGMFLVGDNGSMEDLKTVPRTSCPGEDGCFAQAQDTGEALAATVEGHLDSAEDLSFGPVSSERRTLFVPLENNAFRAAAVAGLFGQRQLYTGGVPTGRTGRELKTSVGVVRMGPDLQWITNPGEAFPGLMLGSPWGIDDPNGLNEDVGCPNRPNPPVPTWHASAPHRFQIGLGDDMIGYEIPPWAFTEMPGIFTNEPPNLDGCVNDADARDPAGHKHKLEAEGVGPSASYEVATQLTSILDKASDPSAEVRLGRFVLPDGSLSRRAHGPLGDAVAVWLADIGSTTLSPGTGKIVALADVGSFGARQVDASGSFMDFDGAEEGGPDVSTRGMLVPAGDGSVSKRYYVDVYPSLTTTPLGPSAAAPEPSISINDVSVTEGNAGTTNAVFTVSLSAPTGRTVKTDYAASPGSAAMGTDFLPSTGTLSFQPNQTSQTLGVQVVGDTVDEPDEVFTVDLSSPVNATLGDASGTGTIVDDDLPAGPGGGAGGANAGGGTTGQSGTSGVTVTPGRKTCSKRRHHHHHRRHCRHKKRGR